VSRPCVRDLATGARFQSFGREYELTGEVDNEGFLRAVCIEEYEHYGRGEFVMFAPHERVSVVLESQRDAVTVRP
jgi:hypothetical protein